MKRISLIMLFLLSGVAVGHAQGFYDIPSDQNLESSLMGLRASAQKIEDRNAWLKKETRRLNEQFGKLQTYLGVLEQRRANLEGSIRKVNQARMPVAQPVSSRLMNLEDIQAKIDELSQEQASLETDVEMKQKQFALLAKRLNQDRADLEAKRNDLKGATTAPLAEDFLKDRKYWTDLVARAQKDVKNSEQTLSQLSRAQSKPSQQLSSKEERKAALKEELSSLQEESKELLAEESSIRTEMQGLASKQQEQSEALDKSIEELSARQQELGRVLAEAKEKLGGKIAATQNVNKEADELQQNLKTVQQVNVSLKDNFGSLEKTLSDLKR